MLSFLGFVFQIQYGIGECLSLGFIICYSKSGTYGDFFSADRVRFDSNRSFCWENRNGTVFGEYLTRDMDISVFVSIIEMNVRRMGGNEN